MLLALSFASCKELPDTDGLTDGSDESTSAENISDSVSSLWDTAVYTEDTTLGEGGKTIYVTVKTPEKSIVITINTDELVLGDAITKAGIAEGDEGAYGLYIKKINGISAVYETDSAYWSILVDGEAAATGADGIEITENGEYTLEYIKA